jgi:hypothetical protein
MYPHATQFETRDAEIRDRIRLDAERRAARAAKRPQRQHLPRRRFRTLLAGLVRGA